MVIKAVLFDLYRTIVDIATDEHDPGVYGLLARSLAYHGVNADPEELKTAYFEEVRRRLKRAAEEYPEVDVYDVFSLMLRRYGNRRYAKSVVVHAALLFRSLTIRRFGLYEGCAAALAGLKGRYKTALVSDAQWVFTQPEMRMLGLDRCFDAVILSSRFGFRKPDTRLFAAALERLEVPASEAVYIGDNPSRDLTGAKRAGMRCILFRPETTVFEEFAPDGILTHYHELDTVLKEVEEGRCVPKESS